MNKPDLEATNTARRRYHRIAPIYDAVGAIAERRYQSWRIRFWEEVERRLSPGSRLLEVGVGTGKNIPYWPSEVKITALDLAPGMLQRAVKRAQQMNIHTEIELGDIQALNFPNDAFEMAAATFVFCSVPNPILGLQELRRTVRPGGYIVLMEHVRSSQPTLGKLMDLINPIVVAVTGVNINRDTIENISRAGLELEKVEDLGGSGIFKFILARVPRDAKGAS